jgi:oligopeptidase B
VTDAPPPQPHARPAPPGAIAASTATTWSTRTGGWWTPTTPRPSPTSRPRTRGPRRSDRRQAALRRPIFDEIKRRTQETDLSVPVRDGTWWYLTRTEEGKSYPIHCRRPDDGTRRPRGRRSELEQVVLDLNELADEGEYLGLGVLDVSPDGNWLAYGMDRDGDERHALRFRDLRTGTEPRRRWPTRRTASRGLPTPRRAGTRCSTMPTGPTRCGATRWAPIPADDVRVLHEPDERFHVSVGSSRSGDLAVIEAGSAITSESWLLDAATPGGRPGHGRCRAPRASSTRSPITAPACTWSRTTAAPRTSPCGERRSTASPPHPARRGTWSSPTRRADASPASRRSPATSWCTVAPTGLTRSGCSTRPPRARPGSPPTTRSAPSPRGPTRAYDATSYRFGYQSLTTPPSVIDLDVATGERTVRKQLPVLDGFDPRATGRRASGRSPTTAPGADLAGVASRRHPRRRPGPLPPLRLRRLRDARWTRGSRSPGSRCSTGASRSPSPTCEAGASWGAGGTRTASSAPRPTRSPTSWPAPATSCDTGRTAPELLAARGGSAGGLLMGAVANLAPEAVPGSRRRGPVRRPAHHHARPDAAPHGHRVGGVGRPAARPPRRTAG